MAIQLSSNTKTTGQLSSAVFDPNIGFKSGLQEFGRGLQQAGRAAGNVSLKMAQKQDITNKTLAVAALLARIAIFTVGLNKA